MRWSGLQYARTRRTAGIRRPAILVVFGLVASALVTVVAGVADPLSPAASASTQRVATDIGMAGNSCAVTDDGEQWCWGPQWDGGLANGTGGYISYDDSPALIPTQSTASSVAKTSGTCLINTAGGVQCWGSDGIIEDGEASLFSNPSWGRNTPGSYGFANAVETVGRCTLSTTATVQCYGWNAYGLGDGSASWATNGYPLTPPAAASAVTVTLADVVDLGDQCAVRNDGTVWCWGYNQYPKGRLGDGGVLTYSDSPVQVPGITDAVRTDGSCAIRSTGAVSCWGLNRGGRFDPTGSAAAVLAPTVVPAFAGAIDVATDFQAACAVLADGSVVCQGSGAIGDGTSGTARTVTLPAFNSDADTLVAEIEAGSSSGYCARTRIGQIACWGGAQSYSGIGIDGFDRVLAPTFVLGFGGGLGAPELGGEIRFEHLDPDDQSESFGVDETFAVVLRVEAGDGDGDLTVSVPGADTLFAGIDEFTVEQSPIDAGGETVDMEPGTFREYTWNVKAVKPARVTIDTTITALNDIGDPVTPLALSEELTIEALRVTIEVDPNDRNLLAHELPLAVTAVVRIENVATEDIDNVTLQSWMDWGPLDPDEILPDVMLEYVDAAAVQAAFGNSGTIDLGTIKPGAANAVTYEYALQATGRAHAELEQLLTYTQDGEQVNELATADLRLGGLLLEFSSRVVRPIASQLLPAGEAIQIEGTIKNISDFTIEVGPPPPKVSGNAGAMSVVFDPTGSGPNPQDTVAPGIRSLKPDEEVDFRVRITTQWSDPRTFGTERSGGTRADIEFTPWGRYLDPEDDTPPIGYIYFETEQMLTDDDQLKHRVSIDDSIEIPEFDALDFSSGVFVGSAQGLGHAAVGIVTGVIETPYAIYNTMRGIYTFIEKVWGSFTPEEHETFKESVLFATYQFMLRSAEIAQQTYEEVKPQLDAMLTNAFTEIAQQWELGDYVKATQTYSRYTSELIGSILIPIALAKLAKAPQAVAAAQRAQAAIQAAAIPALQAVRNTRLVQSIYTSLLSLKSGLIIGVDDIKRLYGIAPDELAEFQLIANAKKYLITVRSRHASSIEWVRDFKAMVKPEALKIKSVNELDIRLGYDTALIDGRQPLGAVVFKKPAPLIRWDSGGTTGDIGQYVKDFVRSKGFEPGTHEYEAALSRTYERMKEWRKFESKYKKANKEGLEVTYNYEGNQIPADVRSAETKYLGFDLQEVPGEPETYIVRLMDEQGFFRPVTGDIDAIAFTKADGSPLNAKEHADLLDQIAANPKLQGRHGETATFDPPGSGLGGVDIIESQFKPGEPALQIMPDTTGARVVRFNPGKSRWNDARDYNLHWDGGYVEMSRRLATGAARPFQVTVPALVIEDATEAFVLEASLDADPNLGRCRVVESDSHPDAVSLFGSDGGLFELLTDGSSEQSDLQATCFSEGEPVDIVIRTANFLSSIFGLFGDSFAPSAAGSAERATGELGSSTLLPVADSSGFDVGDVVTIGAGTDSVDVRTIVSVDPLHVDSPPSVAHAAGALVVVVETGAPIASLSPLTPVRVFESRVGERTVDGVSEGGGRLPAGSVTSVQVSGRGGVASGAAAVAVNVTAIRPSGVGYVTLFPCGEEQPLTSSLNYGVGGVAGNSGIVKLSAAGELCVFTFADTDLVIDVNAWLAEAPSFESLTPARLAETRAGEQTVDGAAQELGRLAAGSVTTVQIGGRGGVDAGADAVALNVTAVRPSGVGYVTLYPCDEERPTTSSLNYSGGGAVGNSAVVSLSATGTLCAFTFADTDLVIDVNAWFADDASFDPFVPARFFESRSGENTVDGVGNAGGRLAAMSVTTIPVAGRGGVPAGASAVALNVTAIRPSGVGFITLFPCDGDQPLTSSLNYSAGGAVGNSGVVKLSASGTVCAYTQADTDLVIDVNAAWTN